MENKYIILVRHGEPDNPKKMVYNLDEVTKKEEITHITDYGKKQLRALGKVIIKKGFRVVKFRYSNQTRAVESAISLNKVLKVKDFKIEPGLKDVYAPGPYLEKLSLVEMKKIKGEVYLDKRWDKYQHENPTSVTKRIDSVFRKTATELKPGQTVILLSHGDPIAFWINKNVSGKYPNPKKLRDLIYPKQGEGIVIVINPENKITGHYSLKDPELLKGKIY